MSGSTSSAQASGGAVVIASRAAVATCQADEIAIATASRTVATRGLTQRWAARRPAGAHAAATRSTPPKRRASRVTFVPTGDGTIQVTSTTRTYTAAPSRTDSHDAGARSRTTAPRTTGRISETSPIGCRPANGKNTAENATTTTGGTPIASAAARRRPSHSAAAAMPRNSPATGLDAVASVARTPASAPRGRRCRRAGVRQRSGHAKITATAPSANRRAEAERHPPGDRVAGDRRGAVQRRPQGPVDGLAAHEHERQQRRRERAGHDHGGPHPGQRHEVRRQDAVGDRVHAAVPGEVVGAARMVPGELRPRVLGGDVAAAVREQPPPEQVEHGRGQQRGEHRVGGQPGDQAGLQTGAGARYTGRGDALDQAHGPPRGRIIARPSTTASIAISTPATSSTTKCQPK